MDNQFSLPAELFGQIDAAAQARGMSVDAFIQTSLKQALSTPPDSDSLYSDTAVYRGDEATDVAANHDKYLYGDAS